MIFGTRAGLERRRKGLIRRDEWRRMRLRPLCSRGDKLFLGNRHFRLSLDARCCVLGMYGRRIALELPQMLGNAGKVLRQAAALAAQKKINLTFRIDDKKLLMTIDPATNGLSQFASATSNSAISRTPLKVLKMPHHR